MLVSEAQTAAVKTLKAAGIETASLDAALILGMLLNFSRTQLIAHDTDVLSEPVTQQLSTLISKRAQGYPVAYILGYKDFYGLTLKVNEHTLIPRPDTELLVEEALQQECVEEVLDLGTGSGAIILALKKQRPNWRCSACDQSPEALQVAKENAQRLGLMVEFKLSDWFSAYQDRRFDLIVSNPPYIAVGDEHLHQTSLPYEPESALVSGPQGLADLDRIIRTARAHLTERGVLILEHGYEQGQACRSLLEQAGFSRCYTKRDLGGQERISVGML